MRRLRYAILFGAVASTGVYLFVYLVRWEWHRALVAGILFVGAEVALATAAILDRLRNLERKVDAASASATAETAGAALARLQESAPEPRTNFEWLTRQSSGMSVFVPLLLGAGIVLSGVAWIVERVARMTAGPVLERGLAVRLAPLGLPSGTLAGAPAPVAPRRRSYLPHVVAGLVAIALATAGLDALADATQTRPDTIVKGTTSAVVVAVDPGSARSALASTDALWGACTTQLGGGYKVLSMTELGSGAVQVLVSPQIGKYAERRLRGCVGDATTDRLSARITSVAAVPGG